MILSSRSPPPTGASGTTRCLALSRMQRTVRAVITTAQQAQEALDAALETLKSYPAETLAADAKRIRGSVSAILRQTGERQRFLQRGRRRRWPAADRDPSESAFTTPSSVDSEPTEEQSRLTRRSYERLTEQVEALTGPGPGGPTGLQRRTRRRRHPLDPRTVIVVPPGARPPQR